MKATAFVYWMQGHFEISNAYKDSLTIAQAQQILKKAEGLSPSRAS